MSPRRKLVVGASTAALLAALTLGAAVGSDGATDNYSATHHYWAAVMAQLRADSLAENQAKLKKFQEAHPGQVTVSSAVPKGLRLQFLGLPASLDTDAETWTFKIRATDAVGTPVVNLLVELAVSGGYHLKLDVRTDNDGVATFEDRFVHNEYPEGTSVRATASARLDEPPARFTQLASATIPVAVAGPVVYYDGA